MKKLTDLQKATAIAIMSSLLADLMDDIADNEINFLKARDKHLPNNLRTCSKKLLKFDEKLINNAPVEAQEQQVNNQILLRQHLEKFFER